MADAVPRPEALNGAVSPQPSTNKVAAQLTKLRDANAKYKNLLKMAKERIEQQEGELKQLRGKERCAAKLYFSGSHHSHMSFSACSRLGENQGSNGRQ